MKMMLCVTMLFCFSAIRAQNQNDTVVNPRDKKNDVKINVFFTVLGLFEAAYERNLNTKSSLGISGLYVFSKRNDEDTNYLITPYYRRYFGKKYAAGFFVEGFTTLGSTDGKQLTDIGGNVTMDEGPDVIDLSLGLSLGGKWVTKGGIVFEVFAGLGGHLFNAEKTDHNSVTRRGINIGYRF